MAFSVNDELPIFIERAKTQTIDAPLYEDGALVAPSSGTVSILDDSGNAIVDGATATITGDIATYQVSAATVPSTLTLSDAWQVVWSLVVSGETHTIAQDAHLVRRVLYPVITDANLMTGRHSDLSSLYPPGVSTWQAYRDAAWVEIQQRLLEAGKRPYLVLNPWALSRVHIKLSLAYIFLDLATLLSESSYHTMARDYRDEFDSIWGELQFQYDFDEDGELSDQDEESAAAESVVYLTASNDRGW